MVSKLARGAALTGEKQRARSEVDKAERREAILRVAADTFTRCGLSFTMADVASLAGLAKGTLYLYFQTKEEMLLAVLQRHLFRWFDEVDASLDGAHPRLGEERIAQLVCDSIAPHVVVTRLLVLLPTVLEHNVDRDGAVCFKRALLQRTASTGARLERRLSFLRQGGGIRLLLQFHALVVGLFQMADPSPVVRAALAMEELAPLRVDFPSELRRSFTALIRGLERAAR